VRHAGQGRCIAAIRTRAKLERRNEGSDLIKEARTWQWLLAATMAALLVISLLPPSVDLPSTGWDKANHALAFAVLGVLGRQSWPGRMPIVMPGLLAYGVLIEVLQSFVPGRDAEFADVVADAVGLALAAAAAMLVARRRARA